VRCIYLSALLPPFNSTSRDAKTAFKIRGALRKRSTELPNLCCRHQLHMTAFERNLALAVQNRFPQPSFNFKV
jgi:hypothetical protein